MKLDKETIVKHHFWILVIVAAVMAMLGWGILLMGAPSTVEAERKKIQTKWDQNKKHKEFVHPEHIGAVRKVADILNTQRAKILGELYDEQMKATTLMTWPPKMETTYNLRKAKYAIDVVIHAKGKGKSKVDLPPDDATHVSGVLKQTDADWFKIKDRKDQTVTLLRTDKPGKQQIDYGKLAKETDSDVTVTFVEGKFFGEELSIREKQAYRDAYEDQLRDVLAELRPVNHLGQPVVLLHYPKDTSKDAKPDPKKEKEVEFIKDVWVYKRDRLPPSDNRFFSSVKNWAERGNDIQTEEIWNAQETMWIQREMYKQIRAANDSLAACQKIQKINAIADGKSATYESYYWKIELTLTDGGIDAKLTNRRPKSQSTDGLRFLLRLKSGDGKDDLLVFPPRPGFEANTVGPQGSGSEVFPATGTVAFNKDPKLTSLDIIESVEQLLTVETAAVKRLDVFAVGTAIKGDSTVSHSQANKSLVPYKKRPATFTKPPDPNDPNPPVDPVPVQVRSPHGLIMDRYLEVNSEFRKVPLLLVVIVSAEHANLVQASLISSPLRYFPTQMLWHRYPLLLSAVPAASPELAVGGGGDASAECVELTLYGVVTIYERPGKTDK